MWVRYVSTLTFVSYKTSQATGDHYIGQDRPEQANEKPSCCRNNQKRKQNKSVMQIGSLGPHMCLCWLCPVQLIVFSLRVILLTKRNLLLPNFHCFLNCFVFHSKCKYLILVHSFKFLRIKLYILV